MIFDEISKASFFASAVVYSEGSCAGFDEIPDVKYTTADAKNDSFEIQSNITIPLSKTFIILEEYEGLGTKRIPGSSGMRCAPKPSYSSKIMKVSDKEITIFDEISKESFFASPVVYSGAIWQSPYGIQPYGRVPRWQSPRPQMAESPI